MELERKRCAGWLRSGRRAALLAGWIGVALVLAGDPAPAGAQSEGQGARTWVKKKPRPEQGLPPESVVTRDPKTDTVRFLRGENMTRELESDPLFRATRSAGDSEGVARAFLQQYAAVFRLDDPRSELALLRIDVDKNGSSHVRFEQRYRGVPIPGAQLIVHLDRARRAVLVSGKYFATPRDLAVEPKLGETEARAAAGACADCAAELVVFAEPEKEVRLAWRVEPPADAIRGEAVTVDAETGDVLRREPLTYLDKRRKPAPGTP